MRLSHGLRMTDFEPRIDRPIRDSRCGGRHFWVLGGMLVIAIGAALPRASAASEPETPEAQWRVLTQQYTREYKLQHYQEAAEAARRAVEAAALAFGPDDPKTAQTLNDLGHLHQRLGEYEQAQRLHRRSLEIRQRRFGAEDPEVAQSLVNLAKADHELGQYSDAEALFSRALLILEKQSSMQQPQVAEILGYLARGHSRAGEDQLAEPFFQRAVSTAIRMPPLAYPGADRLIEEYAACLDRLGKAEKAAAVRKRTDPLFTP